MHTGMLWFDNSKTSLPMKIEKAVEYYVKKHGVQPNLCLVHPSMIETSRQVEISVGTGEIKVRPYRPILPGHVWIGMEDEDGS